MDVFFSTGERSGDQVAAGVARTLRERFGDGLEMVGLVGPLCEAAGVRGIPGGEGKASSAGEVGGFAAWSGKLESVVGMLRASPPKLLVAVTHPTFNLPLGSLVPGGVRRIMIGPPEIWAWQVNALGRAVGNCLRSLPGVAGRPFSPVKAAYVTANRGPMALAGFDDLLCLTPMNAAAFGRLGARTGAVANVVHVRHPVLDSIARAPQAGCIALRRRLGLTDGEHLLGIFPGSRQGEIRRMLPTMLAAAGSVVAARRDVRAVVSVAEPALAEPIAERVRRLGRFGQARVGWTDCPAQDLLSACCHAIVATGTLTLEAALLGVRATAGYAVPWATRFLLRPLFRHERINGRRVPFALPNAICAWLGGAGDGLPYAEAIASGFRPARIAAAVRADLPAGPHGGQCPPLLAADTVRSIREALCAEADSPSAGGYVAEALEQAH
jgi:lipid-A-disaccharide synthase